MIYHLKYQSQPPQYESAHLPNAMQSRQQTQTINMQMSSSVVASNVIIIELICRKFYLLCNIWVLFCPRGPRWSNPAMIVYLYVSERGKLHVLRMTKSPESSRDLNWTLILNR